MKLGAQLYSIRTFLKTEEDLKNSFAKIKKIGYENVQLSGAAPMPAEYLREVSAETGLAIVCTHSPFERITGDTEALIAEHRIFGCPVIGLGSMPKEYRGTREGYETFLRQLETPVKKILDAGLHFAYHNHSFEFDPLDDGSIIYDEMLERLQNWQFIMDTYWVEFAGRSAVEYIGKIGGKRLPNIHFKDMAKDEKRSICPCGSGVLDFQAIFEKCREVGVQNALVEQDNAVQTEDPFAEMEKSFGHLRKIVK